MRFARQDGAAGELVENVVLLLQDGPNQFFPGIDPQAVENQDHGLLAALGVPMRLQHSRHELVREDQRRVGLIDPLDVIGVVQVLELGVGGVQVQIDRLDALVELLLRGLPTAA